MISSCSFSFSSTGLVVRQSVFVSSRLSRYVVNLPFIIIFGGNDRKPSAHHRSLHAVTVRPLWLQLSGGYKRVKQPSDRTKPSRSLITCSKQIFYNEEDNQRTSQRACPVVLAEKSIKSSQPCSRAHTTTSLSPLFRGQERGRPKAHEAAIALAVADSAYPPSQSFAIHSTPCLIPTTSSSSAHAFVLSHSLPLTSKLPRLPVLP